MPTIKEARATGVRPLELLPADEMLTGKELGYLMVAAEALAERYVFHYPKESDRKGLGPFVWDQERGVLMGTEEITGEGLNQLRFIPQEETVMYGSGRQVPVPVWTVPTIGQVPESPYYLHEELGLLLKPFGLTSLPDQGADKVIHGMKDLGSESSIMISGSNLASETRVLVRIKLP